MALYKRWEPLPKIFYGFSIHPFVPEVDALDPGSAQLDHIDPAQLEALQNDLIALEVGDEVYVFEQLGHANVSWYRGYVVSTQRTAAAATSANSLSDYSTLPGVGLASAGGAAAVAEEPQVYVAIFPASYVHIREQLDDAELRLASIYAKAQELGIIAATAPLPRQNAKPHMETLPEVDETASLPPSPHGNSGDPRGPEVGLNGQLVEQPPPPLPSLKCGDETAAGAAEPLVDEIACALREWATLMYTYLGRRDYALFLAVKEHIEVLHMARRQLLAQTLSAEEVGRLRRECVARLVKGNVAQGLDVIVRHPGRGGLVEVDFSSSASKGGHHRHPDSWVSGIRLFALQAASAYVDQDDEAGGIGGVGAMEFAAAAAASNAFGTTLPSTTASGILASTYSRKTSMSLTRAHSISAAAAIGGGGAGAGELVGSAGGRAAGPNASSNNRGNGGSGGVKYFHVLLDLKALVASLCGPGETAELYFSLYNRAESRFLTEEFCVVLNHNGAPTRESEGRLGRMRTLFTDLSAADMQDLNIVCRIIRNGAMRLGTAAGGGDASYPAGAAAAAGATGNDGRSAAGAGAGAAAARAGEHGDNGPAFRRSRMTSERTFRRPFGCAVLELGQHHRFSPDVASSSTMREHIMPIFVPVNEAAFSTLHQDIIASRIKEFEKSPRADVLAVNAKVFHGGATALIRENPSLLADVPLTARLGFPDVVFPGDRRNEAYIKLWSGEFFPTGGKMSGSALKNIQVSAEVRTRDGRVVEHVISRGAGEPPVTQFDSIVFYHQNAPTWGELLKLQLPHDIMEECHMFFSFRNRSTKEERGSSSSGGGGGGGGASSSSSSSDLGSRPFAHAYLPLFESNRAFIPDGSHTLFLWCVSRPPSQIGPDLYFNLPPVVPAGRSPTDAVPANLAATVQPLRDIVTLRTFLVSTQYTQNDVLLELLNWEERAQSADFEELRSVLTKFTFVGEVEIVKFLRDIFDALFGIAASARNAHGELDDLVFNGLVTVLGIVQDRRFTNFRATLDVYIERHFRFTTAHNRLIASMAKLLAEPGRMETSKDLRAAIKVWPYLFRFVIQSRQNQRGERDVGGGAVLDHLEAGFKRELDALLRSINSLMNTTKPSSIIGTQTLALQHFAGILPDLAKVFMLDELVRIAMSFADSVFITKGRMAIWKLLHILQVAQGPLFESLGARSQLIPSIVRWIRPHLGRYDEASHVGSHELEAARDTARVAWFEAARLSVTILAVILDRLQTSLATSQRRPPSAAIDAELRQEQDNVDYVLGTMPKLLETYKEFGGRAMIKTLQRHRAPSTTASSVPVIFPSSYPFPLIAKRPQGNPAATTGPSSRRHRRRDGRVGGIGGGGAGDFLNCGLGEIASVLIAQIMLSPRKHLASFLDEERDLGGHELCGKFLGNFFEVASSILLNAAFPSTWLNINILAHQMVLKMADPLAAMLVRDFIPPADQSHSFDTDLWRAGLGMLLTLLSSEQLVIEQFKPQRRRAVWRLAGDIRGEGAQIFAKLWTSIGWPEKLSTASGEDGKHQQQTGYRSNADSDSGNGQGDGDSHGEGEQRTDVDQMNTGGFQVQFVPSLVEPVLELCLSHHDELRTCAVRVLATMITSEWHLNGDFTVIEAEIIDKLDILFMTDTKGDEISRAFFIGQLRSLFDSPHVDARLREQVHACLISVNRFLDLLLSVRSMPLEEGFEDDRIAGTLKLLGFLRQANRVAAFSTHVLRLANLHLENLNYVEAALTLKLHADLHTWDMNSFVEPIPELDLPKQSHFARKETLYMLILEYLSKGEAWEIAIDICRELAQQYECRSVNYARLAEVLQHQAVLYQRIASVERTFPSYFRVAYYGLGWPAALQNKMFVYRGLDWEKLAAFCDRLHAKHPKATLIKSTGTPGDEVRHVEAQFLQITALQPEPDRTKDFFTNPEVPPIVRAYHEHNTTDLFSFTRPLPTPANAAAAAPSVEFQDVWVKKTYLRCEDAFPTVLRRSEVAEVYVAEISPLENALNDVQAKTEELETLEKKYGALGKVAGRSVNTNRLSMALNGAVDAPINGGIPMYRRAFCSPAYAEANPDKAELLGQLRRAIDAQALVIFRCIRLHAQLCPPEMRPFHDTLQRFFAQGFADETERLELDISKLGSDAAPASSVSIGSRDDSLDGGNGAGGKPERFASRSFAFGAINNHRSSLTHDDGSHGYSLDRNSRAQQAAHEAQYGGGGHHVPPSPLQRHISYLTKQGGSAMVLARSGGGGNAASLAGTITGGSGGGGQTSPSSPGRSAVPFYEAPGIGGMPRPSMAPSDSTARADGSGYRVGSMLIGGGSSGGNHHNHNNSDGSGPVPQRYPIGVAATQQANDGSSNSLFSKSGGGGGGGGNRLSKLMSVRRKPSQQSE